MKQTKTLYKKTFTPETWDSLNVVVEGLGYGKTIQNIMLGHTHTAPWWLRSALSQGKIRECGKAWETTEECAFLCTIELT